LTTTDPSPALRLTALTAIVAVLFVGLVSRLWFLQVLAGDRYERLAESNAVRVVLTEAPRGEILDRNGVELVKNRVAHTISADRMRLINAAGQPKDEIAAAVLDRLSILLELSVDEIIQRLASPRYSPFRPIPIAIDVAPEIVFAVSEHAELFPGVVPERLPVRTYPQGQLAAHLVGHVAEIGPEELEQERYQALGYRAGDLIGRAGLEDAYEEHLHGVEGLRKLEVNARGTVLGVLGEQPYQPGNDLVTTLDIELQQEVELLLEEGILLSRESIHTASGRPLLSTGGSVVVMDPRNGEILALASYPTFDPREFVGGLSQEYARYLYPQEGDPETHSPAINRAIASAQPPGSTWKIVSGLAALQANQITPDTTVECPGVWGWGKRNWNPRNEGRMDLATALMRSCDTFFYELSYNQWLGENRAVDNDEEPQERYQQVARALGFDEPLGIDVPGERGGIVPGREWKQSYWEATKDDTCARAEAAEPGSYARQLYSELCNEGFVWRGGDAVNMSIGQGDVQATPLQIASSYATVANGGTVWWPHLGKEIRDPAGRLVERVEPRVLNQIEAPPDHWDEMRRGLEAVIMAPRGTAATPFAGFPLDQIPVAGKTGTAEAGSTQIPYSWFAAYAPANDPQYVVVVMIEQGGGGSQTAAPIVRRILEATFDLPVSPFRAGPGNVD
jgi:penicillin-binding protein 2